MAISFNDIQHVTIDSYNSRANQILHKTETAKAQNAKIDKSAKDFESLLIGGWLEQAQKSFATVPGGDEEEDADPGKEQLQGLSMQSLSTALTASGGLGISAAIAKLLHKSADSSASAPKQPAAEVSSLL